MKKLFVFLTAIVLTASSWATPSAIENEKIIAAFEKEFTGATEVQWSPGKDEVFLATFLLNNEKMRAWFTMEGDVVAIQRDVKKEQMTYLSAKTLMTLEEQQKIISIAEVNKDGDMYYLVHTENDKYKNVYKLTAAGSLSRIDKKKKK